MQNLKCITQGPMPDQNHIHKNAQCMPYFSNIAQQVSFVILFSSTVLWIGQKPEGSEQGPHGVLLDRLRQSQRET